MSAAFIAMVLLQAAASAPAQRPPPATTDMPGWSRTPTAAEMAAAYPADAKAANFAGSATVECTVGADGGLTACETASTSGPGFGAAALAVAAKFQMPTKAPSGAPTAGRTVRFPIQWVNPATSKAPPLVVFDDAGRSGSVGFNCRVRDDRSLDNCVVVDTRPRGTTLLSPAGEAALRYKAAPSVKPGARLLVVVEVKPRDR